MQFSHIRQKPCGIFGLRHIRYFFYVFIIEGQHMYVSMELGIAGHVFYNKRIIALRNSYLAHCVIFFC